MSDAAGFGGGFRMPHCVDCDLVIAPATPLAADAMIDGRYRVLGPLGQGGAGDVYAAHDVHLDRAVAIKVPKTRSGSSSDAFLREARALASLRHPHIPAVHAFGVYGTAPFFVMELVAGDNLRHILESFSAHEDHVPLHRAEVILKRIAAALSAAHGARILHRDVKPENVIIEQQTGRPVLVDFGTAVDSEEIEGSRQVVGTPHFMAPEVLRGQRPTVQSDIYALGCTAYELLTGSTPFDGDTVREVAQAHFSIPPPRPSATRPEAEPFDPLIAKALAKRPEDRFATSAAFSMALAAAMSPRGAAVDAEITELVPDVYDAVRILVVDDDAVSARVAARCAQVAFARARVSVARAHTGDAALRSAQQRMPQLLLLDFHLPGHDGVEVLSRIRDMPGGESVEVIVMSGAVGERERWRFSVLGVTSFLGKPVPFSQLVHSIRHKGRQRGWLPRDPDLESGRHDTEDEPT